MTPIGWTYLGIGIVLVSYWSWFDWQWFGQEWRERPMPIAAISAVMIVLWPIAAMGFIYCWWKDEL